ncbi:hypothetical protein Tco_0781787 [Tanacetum coccineum]
MSGRGRDPAYAFLLIGQVVCALGTFCPLFCWLELPLWLPSHFLLLLAFSATFGGDTDGGSDDEGSAAANSTHPCCTGFGLRKQDDMVWRGG